VNELVTIGIPTYSRLTYLKEAVASAMAQTYRNIEVVISQNPHPDRSVTEAIAAWCRELAQRHSNVRHHLNPTDVGPPANFNAAADAARGEYLLMIGDDDRLLPNCVEQRLHLARSSREVVFSNYYLIDALGERLVHETDQLAKRRGRDRLPAGELVTPEAAAWQRSVVLEASMIHTKTFQQMRFREDHDCPDTAFFILLARQGGRFVFTPEYLSEVRLHQQSNNTAGLRPHGLVAQLLALAVDAEVEPYKQDLMGLLMPHAISCCMVEGDVRLAREFLDSAYYPRAERRRLRGVVQRSCATMPTGIACTLYRAIHRAKNSQRLRARLGSWLSLLGATGASPP
jgi:glycosyltransferase involved in cell wall biosynthesis